MIPPITPRVLDSPMSLHPLTRDWGEGTATCGPRGGGQGDPANPGDATCLRLRLDPRRRGDTLPYLAPLLEPPYGPGPHPPG